ncbi:MAG: hypothetical protein LBH93_06270 [Chitinispirillales bacterium]|jgi:hypothetical protein|nr:hypothetical protein [Chitinispirillales bacterium]
MIKERAGESVFGNADEALAGKIISRSKRNSKEPERAFSGMDAGVAGGVGGINGENSINSESGINSKKAVNSKNGVDSKDGVDNINDKNGKRCADGFGERCAPRHRVGRKSLSPIAKIAIPVLLAAIALLILTRGRRDG